jgi:hypothetical protein
MYSRSYGLIEQSEKGSSVFSVPPDYNGNLYRKTEKREAESIPIPKEPASENPKPAPSREEAKTPSASSGITGGFLERLTAEDILLFVFLFALLKGEKEDVGDILGLILALLLL